MIWGILLLCCWDEHASAETVNRILAVVNDEIITEADVLSRLATLLEDEEVPASAEANSETMQAMVLDRLIEQRLLLQEAKRVGVRVTSEDVLSRLEAMRDRFDSEEAFQQSLASSNLSEELLKEQLREQLLVQRLIDAKVRATIVVSPQEVARQLEMHPEWVKSGDRVLVRHLLVRVAEMRSESEARALITSLHQQLLNGGDFESLARRYSEDVHRDDGGLMGWVAQGELLPELDTTVFALAPGQLSDPIQSRLGFHLVKVEERRPSSNLSVLEAHQTVYQRLYDEKFNQRIGQWLLELKRKAYIEILGVRTGKS